MSQWFYAVNNQQNGPVSESELKQLVSLGRIQPDDLVWSEGMNDWQAYRAVFGAAGSPALASPPRPGNPAASVSGGARVASDGFGTPAPDSPAARLGLRYDFGDILCWGIAIMLVPCLSIFGYVGLIVLFVLEFIEAKKAVDDGRAQPSTYTNTNPILLVLGLFCCSIIFYPLFMHWRNQSGLFKPQPHAVWFSILILIGTVILSIALNGAAALAEALNQISAQ